MTNNYFSCLNEKVSLKEWTHKRWKEKKEENDEKNVIWAENFRMWYP